MTELAVYILIKIGADLKQLPLIYKSKEICEREILIREDYIEHRQALTCVKIYPIKK